MTRKTDIENLQDETEFTLEDVEAVVGGAGDAGRIKSIQKQPLAQNDTLQQEWSIVYETIQRVY